MVELGLSMNDTLKTCVEYELRVMKCPFVHGDCEGIENRGVSLCAPNLQTCGFKSVDDVTLVSIFSAAHMGLNQKSLVLINGCLSE